MDQKTVNKIMKNAVAAGDILKRFQNEGGSIERLCKSFHLRPTSKGITLVSMLPEAPMRGVLLPKAEEDAVKLLKKAVEIVPSDRFYSDGVVVEKATELGFEKRNNVNPLEEGIQAQFIREMMAEEEAYQGIHFVASELTIGDNKRFDVVGIKGTTLYLFELKRDRSKAAAPQVKAYCYYVEQYKDTFRDVLSSYPLIDMTKKCVASVPSFESVKGIAVMCYAANSPLKTWKDWKEAALDVKSDAKHITDISDVDIWLYNVGALSFRKLSENESMQSDF